MANTQPMRCLHILRRCGWHRTAFCFGFRHSFVISHYGFVIGSLEDWRTTIHSPEIVEEPKFDGSSIFIAPPAGFGCGWAVRDSDTDYSDCRWSRRRHRGVPESFSPVRRESQNPDPRRK